MANQVLPVPLWKQRSEIIGISALEEAGYNIEIEQIATGRYVSFPAFVENFSDAYTSDWNSEQVFGRMDPIATFSHTRRAISVAWVIPADSIERARQNMERINILLQMLYPLYTKREGATTMNMGPLMRIRYLNLMQRADSNEGLLGYVNGFTMDPLTEEGSFYGTGTGGSPEIFPKTVRLNFELTVLHEHSLGFVKGEGSYVKYEKGNGKIKSTSYVFRGNPDSKGANSFPYDTTPLKEDAVAPDSVRQRPATVRVGGSDIAPYEDVFGNWVYPQPGYTAGNASATRIQGQGAANALKPQGN